MDINTVYIDMDGVIADFHSGIFELFDIDEWGKSRVFSPVHGYIPNILGIDENTFWGEIRDKGENFWASLDLLPWARQLMNALGDEFEFLYIITSISPCPDYDIAVKGKHKWLENNFALPFDLYVREDKGEVADPHSLLIDDSYKHTWSFNKAGGHSILFPRPYNTYMPVEHVVDYIMNHIKVIKNANW